MINKEKKSDKLRNFDVTVIDKSRRSKTVQVSATNIQQANLQGINHGNVIKVKRKKKFGFGNKLTSSERYLFLNVLATMLSSKVSTGDAFKLLSDSYSGRIGTIARAMHKQLENGKNIDEAMEEMGEGAFPSAIVALVRAGSRGGDSAKALMEASTFEQELNDVKKQSSKGMGSAVFGFLSAGAFLIGSSFYMSPKVKDSPMFRDVQMDTSLVDLMANVLGWFMIVIMVLFVLLILLSSVFKQVAPNLSDSIILRIPLYRDIVLARNAYSTLYGLSMLLGSGVRIEDSLQITKDNAKKGALRTDLEKALKAIRSGNANWPDVMKKTLHPTDRASLKMARDREQIAKTLYNLSVQYRRLYASRLQIIIPTMQLTSALLLSLTGVIMFAQVIMPMLNLTQTLT